MLGERLRGARRRCAAAAQTAAPTKRSASSPSPAASRPRCPRRSRPPSRASRASRSRRASTPPTAKTRSSTCPACWCASATSATTTTPSCRRRASGTGNSARSAVYADGILLSNYLGNGIANGTNYAPRWGLVTPEEIERVDVMYGPFSAAYPGNSAGAVVDYVTRMPTKFEAHVKLGYVVAAQRPVQHAHRPSAAGRPAPRWAAAAATGRGGSTSTARQRRPAADLHDRDCCASGTPGAPARRSPAASPA